MNQISWSIWKHFVVGIAIGIVMQTAAWWLLPPKLKLVTVVSLLLVMILNYGFEVYSRIQDDDNYDVINPAAGTIGGVIGMAVVLVVQFQS